VSILASEVWTALLPDLLNGEETRNYTTPDWDNLLVHLTIQLSLYRYDVSTYPVSTVEYLDCYRIIKFDEQYQLITLIKYRTENDSYDIEYVEKIPKIAFNSPQIPKWEFSNKM